MGLFRKKTSVPVAAVDLTRPLPSTLSASVLIAEGSHLPTAGVAIRWVWPHIASWGHDARLFLIVSDSVDVNGKSPQWQFHTLYPTLRAEAVWTVHPSDDRSHMVGSYRLWPVPEPGSSEYLLALVSPQIAVDQIAAWNDRLSRIKPLPHQFHDSSEVAAEFHNTVPNPFGSGTIRLKARRLPSGETVWEHSGVDLHRSPFAVSQSIGS